MTSNCIVSSLFGETNTFIFSSIIHDILNLHQPLFDSFMSKLHHLSMVKHCKFVCYYQVRMMMISTVVKFYYRGLQLDRDLEDGLTFKTKLSDVISKANANPLGSIIFKIHSF